MVRWQSSRGEIANAACEVCQHRRRRLQTTLGLSPSIVLRDGIFCKDFFTLHHHKFVCSDLAENLPLPLTFLGAYLKTVGQITHTEYINCTWYIAHHNYFVTLTFVEAILARKGEEKQTFLLHFPRLFVTLAFAEATFARKRKEKQAFLLLFSRLFVPLQTKQTQ